MTSVAVPGLGTGVGGMAAADSAIQMRAAYDMIVLEKWKEVAHPVMAPFALDLSSEPRKRQRSTHS
jgi:hypothetical protein